MLSRRADKQIIAPATSPVSVSVRELIDLARAAHGLDLRRLRQGTNAGDHTSRLQGRGMEFDESRPYQPGDDPRSMDWRVMARTGRPFTKVFREERERPVLFVIDLRRSMHFATRGVFKAVLAARLASILAWAAERGGDRVGGFVFSEDSHRECEPRLGRRGVLALIHDICHAPVWNEASEPLGSAESAALNALRGLRKVGRSGSLVLVFSDARDLSARALAELTDLGRRNDIVFFHIVDPIDRTLPPTGHYRWTAGRRGSGSFSSSPTAAERHRDRFTARVETLQQALLGLRSHYHALETDADPAATLIELYGRSR
ncbi:MAG: DUF58 domain-containing protein [Pseudomonadota bacterium]